MAVGGQGDSSPAAALAVIGDTMALAALRAASPKLLDATNSHGESAAHVASARVLQWLADHGTDVWQNAVGGRTTAHSAALRGDVAVLAWLHRHGGGSILAGASDGQQPVHFAAAAGSIDVVMWLHRVAGADVGAQDASGQCPLHLAARALVVELMSYLADNGADVTAKRTRDNATAAHFAASGEGGADAKIAALMWLEERGVDLWATTVTGMTPADVAAIAPGNTAEVVDWLVSRHRVTRHAEL